MNYNEIKELCDSRKIQVNDICRHIGMTYQGLKAGLKTGKIGSDKVVALCKALGITPNAFFGWEKIAPVSSIEDAQPMALRTIEILHEQLRVKDEQIQEILKAIPYLKK